MARASVKRKRGQLSLEFLVILAVLLVYLGSVLGAWKYSFDRLDLAAQRIAVNKVADELEFYSRFLSSSKGTSGISVILFPTTRMAIMKNENGILVASCSSQNGELSYERDIETNATVEESFGGGVACNSYPITGTARLLVKKTIEGGLEIGGKNKN